MAEEKNDNDDFNSIKSTPVEVFVFNSMFKDGFERYSHLTGLQGVPSETEYILAKVVAHKINAGGFAGVTFDSEIAEVIEKEIDFREEPLTLPPHLVYSTTANRFMKKLLPGVKEALKKEYDKLVFDGKFSGGKFTNMRAMGVWYTIVSKDLSDYNAQVSSRELRALPQGRFLDSAEERARSKEQ